MTVSPWPFVHDDPEADAERRAALAPFDAKVRGTWRWEQPSRWRARWTLAVDGRAVGELAGHAAFGTRARATFAARMFTLRPRFPGDVLVFAEDGAEPIVRHRASWWGGGRLERAGQPVLLWRRESFWRTRWGVHTAEKLPLVHVITHPALLRRGAEIGLEEAARTLPDLDALLALAWFLAMRAQHHHGAH